MTMTVVRTITIQYKSREHYEIDRAMWYVPNEGNGYFGTDKHWHQTITEIEED